MSLQTTKALQSQLQNLESMKVELAVTESQLEDWLNDVKEWADGEEMTSVCVCVCVCVSICICIYIYISMNNIYEYKLY